MEENLLTKNPITWCPGCFNFQILSGVKNTLSKSIKEGKKKEDFAIVSGIGCNGKIFDYLNLNGINTLHGRVLPTCLGMKIGNPNLTILGFSGDGDAYAEGIEHLVHMARYNSDIKYIIHNNQIFALTGGEPTPTTSTGFKDKTTPQGVKVSPINPIKLMLSSGTSFVARVFADVKQVENILEAAFKHKGFTFIEIIQPCIIFNNSANLKSYTYNLQEAGHNKNNIDEAMKKADEFDYNQVSNKTKIPLGIFYQEKKPVFEDLYPIISNLKKEKKCFKDIKR